MRTHQKNVLAQWYVEVVYEGGKHNIHLKFFRWHNRVLQLGKPFAFLREVMGVKTIEIYCNSIISYILVCCPMNGLQWWENLCWTPNSSARKLTRKDVLCAVICRRLRITKREKKHNNNIHSWGSFPPSDVTVCFTNDRKHFLSLWEVTRGFKKS